MVRRRFLVVCRDAVPVYLSDERATNVKAIDFDAVIDRIQRRYLAILGELYERLSLEAMEE